MAVLRLIEYQCRETLAILRVLLDMAAKGKLRGLVVCYRTEEGHERTVYTGLYKAKPSAALGVSLKASIEQMQATGEID